MNTAQRLVAPEETHAVIIGIEKYQAGWSLDGAAADGVRFACWLLDRGVPPAQIHLFLSPLRAVSADWLRACGAPDSWTPLFLPCDHAPAADAVPIVAHEATLKELTTFFTERAPALHGQLLFLFWGGHGVIAGEATRRLFAADATKQHRANLDFNNLITRLQSARYLPIRQQIHIVDACANRYASPIHDQLPNATLEIDNRPSRHEQFILLASSDGQFADNLSDEQTGLFSKVLLETLALTPREVWPPSMRSVTDIVVERVRAAQPEQIPAYFWSRDESSKTVLIRGGLGSPDEHWRSDQTPAARDDWGDAPSAGSFRGREADVTALAEVMRRPDCRLMAVTGLSGTGSTALATHAARKVRAEFLHVVWRSLRHAPAAADFLESLIRAVGDRHVDPAPDVHGRIAQLHRILRQHRCLIVLAHGRSLFQPGGRAGRLRQGYEPYEELFQTIVEADHRSCVVFASSEVPSLIAQLAGTGAGVYRYPVGGVTAADAQALLAPWKIFGPDLAWSELVSRYSGNISALRIAASTIRDVMDGDIASFLQNGSMPRGAREFIERQLADLPRLDRDVIETLAVETEPLRLDALAARLPGYRAADLQGSVETLCNRSLLDRTERGFVLPRLILEYETDGIVERVTAELAGREGVPGERLVDRRLLVDARGSETARRNQRRLLAQPVAHALKQQHGAAGARTVLMVATLAARGYHERDAKAHDPVHFGSNIAAVLASLEALDGFDLSRLPVRDGDFQRTPLHDVDLQGADLTGSIFREAFSIALSVAFTPDGQRVVAGIADGTIRIWQRHSGILEQTITAHEGWVWSVAVNHDGGMIASSSDDGSVAITEVATGRVRRLRGHRNWVRTVAFSPDGSQLVTGSEDRRVLVWDVRSGTPVRELLGHDDQVWSAQFHPSDGGIVSGSSDGTVCLWASGATAPTVRWQADAGRVLDVAISHDGEWVATGGDSREVRIWRYRERALPTVLQGHTQRVWSIAFAADNRSVVSSSEDLTIRVWDRESRECVRTLFGHTNWVRGIALDHASRTVASASDDHSVRIWGLSDGRAEREMHGFSDPVVSLAYVDGARTLAAGCSDNSVRLWDLDARTYQQSEAHTNKVWCVAVSRDGAWMATASDDETIRLWETNSLSSSSEFVRSDKPIWCVAFNPDASLLAGGGEDGQVWVWRREDAALVRALPDHQTWVRTVAFSPDGRHLASGGDDCAARLWDVDTGLCEKVLSGHSARLWHVAFAHDGRRLATAAEDGLVCLWDVDSGERLEVFEGHEGCVWSVAFSPDGRLLASAGSDRTVRFWDLVRTASLAAPRQHTHWVRTVTFDPSGTTLASGSLDGTIRLWNPRTFECTAVVRKDRPYERTRIRGAYGITAAQRAAMIALGAIDE